MIQTRIAALRIPNPKLTRGEAQAIINECLDEIEKLQRRRGKALGPTLSECMAYGEKIGMPAGESEAFFDSFTAKGWKMGQRGTIPMRDFEAAMRTWKRNHAKFLPVNGNGSKSPEGWEKFIAEKFPNYKHVQHKSVPEFIRLEFARCRHTAKP